MEDRGRVPSRVADRDSTTRREMVGGIMASFDLSDYIPVNARVYAFKVSHPEGRLVSEIVETGHEGFIAVKAYAYRSPEDPLPGVGLAWERVPGPTPFTKDSELQNAETAAWGRALIAALIADASKGIASRDEVASRQAAPEEISPAWLLWERAMVFKDWDDDTRKAAIRSSMESLAIEQVTTPEDVERVFSHLTGVYAEREDG